jgi:hypothetical protein
MKTDINTNGTEQKIHKWKPLSYSPLILSKGAKNLCWRKQVMLGKLAIHSRRLTHYLSTWTTINSKPIKDCNRTPETLKLLQENTARNQLRN